MYFTMSQKIGEETGDKNLVADAYNNIGGYYDQTGNYTEALKNFLHALKLREQTGNKEGQAAAHRNIGYIYLTLRKFDEAMEHLTKKLTISKEIGNTLGIADGYNNLGNIYSDQQKNDEALKHYNMALKINLENGYVENTAFLYLNIGDLYKKLEKYDDAVASYLESIKVSKQIGYDRALTISYIQLGAVYETLGDLDKALEFENLGLELAEKANYLDMQKQAYRIRAMIHYKSKNFKAAFDDENNYLLLYEHLFNDETNRNITQMQLQYDFDKKEAAAKAQLEKQKLIRNLIYSAMALAVLFLTVLLVQHNKIAKERRQIALEQERMRISRDLHDDLGSGLTGILMMSEQLQATSTQELVSNNIEKIKNSSRQMVEQMGEIVWAMNSKNDTLENLVGYLNTYAADYFENSHITQRIHLPESIPNTNMTGMMRRNVFLVVKESLNNITKHANATTVSMHINIENNKMNITLTDNGKGFEMAQTRRFGNGLKNMHSRMADIKGHYQIESAIEKGTKTTISFPLAS
jgi:signal transduction histidine kinase